MKRVEVKEGEEAGERKRKKERKEDRSFTGDDGR